MNHILEKEKLFFLLCLLVIIFLSAGQEESMEGFCLFVCLFFGSLTGKRTRAVAVFGKLLGLQQIMPASAGGKCQEPEAVVRHPARVLIHMFKFT